MTTAKIFQHGGSQAVRLPKAFRFPGTEVLIERHGDEVVLRPVSHSQFKSFTEIARDDKTRVAVEGYVEELNKHLNRWEQVKKFAIIDRELTVESGDLTPSLKLKRSVVMREHPNTPVIMTTSSRMLIERMLHNSANVMMRQKDEANIPDYPLFTHDEIDRIGKRLNGLPFGHAKHFREIGRASCRERVSSPV